MTLVDYLKVEKQRTNSALETSLSNFCQQSTKIDKTYGELAQSVAELILRGGKRLRPLLVRLGHDLVATQPPNFNLLQASIYSELLHVFMLIHDDIADRDLKRYGGPTLEIEFSKKFSQKFGYQDKHFGLSLALIAGDLVHIIGTEVMLDTDLAPEIKIKVMRQMQKVLHQVIAGWHMHFWQNHVPLAQASIDQYLKGMELVSASYTIQSPLVMGSILAKQEEKFSRTFEAFGHHVGMAFQIQDDILGVYGDTQITGKPAGNDIREGKKTLLVLNAYNKATLKEKLFLEAQVGNINISAADLAEVKVIMERTNSLKTSHQTAKDHIDQALEILHTFPDTNPFAKQKLGELAHFVLQRNA